MGKEDIARYELFLLFPKFFKRFLTQTRKNKGLFGKELKLCIVRKEFNFSPNDEILDWSELNVFADDKLNVALIIKSIFERVKRHCGKTGK